MWQRGHSVTKFVRTTMTNTLVDVMEATYGRLRDGQRLLQELQLRIVAESPAEGIVIVEDEARGLKHLIVDCEAPILVFTQKILPVPARPGELFRRLLQMNRTLTHGAFVLDETAHHVLLHDTLALAHLDGNKVQGTIDALSLALAEHGEELIAFSRPGVA